MFIRSLDLGRPNSYSARTRSFFRYLLLLPVVAALLLPALRGIVPARRTSNSWYRVRTISTGNHGSFDPRGLAWSATAGALFIADASGVVTGLRMNRDPFETNGLHLPPGASLNMAADEDSGGLIALDALSTSLDDVALDGSRLPGASEQYDLGSLSLQNVRGISFDPADGTLYMLNHGGRELVIVERGTAGDERRLDLAALGYSSMRGVAFNPANRHIYLLDETGARLREVSRGGRELADFDLSTLGLVDPQTILFAPSGDPTDDPAWLSLFILEAAPRTVAAAQPRETASQSSPHTSNSPARDVEGSPSAGGTIVEVALRAPAPLPPGTLLLAAKPVNIVDTSNAAWSPSSPDPSGVDYWPLTGRLLIADSEVDEMPAYFTGVNIFDATTSGTLVSTCSTTNINLTGWSTEPTGLAINPDNNRIYISDDSKKRVFEVGLGPDNAYCTADDTLTSVSFVTDTEDVAYGNNTLFIAGGTSAEVYQFDLGPDGVLGGGDDLPVTHWDTASLGFNDLEGIEYNADTGTLFLVSTQASDRHLGEATTSGELLRAWDLSFMGPQANIRSDVTYAPSSADPLVKNIYIVSRGLDNNAHPTENDGRWWEIALATEPNTPTPTASNTPTSTATNTPTSTPTATPANQKQIDVTIAGTPMGTYLLQPGQQMGVNYAGVDSGPVVVQSAGAVPIVSALRDLWNNGSVNTSYAQMMGLPAGQLSTKYVFPSYNNVSLDEQLRFGNVGSAATTVTVTIGGIIRGTYLLQPGEQRRVNYAGLDSGPVIVQSSGGVKITAALRDAWWDGSAWTSFVQTMGLPFEQLSTRYVFPSYNNFSLDEQLRFGNVGTAPTTVTVTIGGVVRGTYLLQPNEQRRVNYAGLDSGPVSVESSGGVKIIAALRDSWWNGARWTSYSQMMGLPAAQISTKYVFPTYDNISVDEQLRFGNIGSVDTTVTVTIGGVVQGTYLLHPSEQRRIYYAGLKAGPVIVQSSAGVPIIVALRDSLWDGSSWTSFTQMMGLPGELLSDRYSFPSYNNVSLNEELGLGVP